MKTLLKFTLIALLATSCKDDCTQYAYCQLISNANYGAGDKRTVCHNGSNLSINEKAYINGGHGQTHEDGTSCYDGECGETLSSNDLEFRQGEIVEIPCEYELPFVHRTPDGKKWFYTKPN